MSELHCSTPVSNFLASATAAEARLAIGVSAAQSIASLIRASPLTVPVRGFASGVANNTGIGPACAVTSDGFRSHLYGTLQINTPTNLQTLFDVPNGFAPSNYDRSAVYSYENTGQFTPMGIDLDLSSAIAPKAGLRIPAGFSNSNSIVQPNFSYLPQANCSGGIGLTLGSDTVSILIPRPLPDPSAIKVCLYFHGSGNDCYSHLSDASGSTSTSRLMQGTVNALLNDGWVILSSNGGSISNNWGNPASYSAIQAAIAWVDANLGNRSKTVVLGQSMGALASLKTATSYPEITKWYGIYPVTNLNGWAGTSSFQSAVFTAWGVASTGALAAASVGYDPVQFDTSVFNGKNFRMTASTSDTVVPKANNTDVLVSYITGNCDSVNVVTHTGNHGDPSAFQPTDILAFFNP